MCLARAGLKTIMTHGNADPILPLIAGRRVEEVLREGGLEYVATCAMLMLLVHFVLSTHHAANSVEFTEFVGQHTLSQDTPDKLARLLSSITTADGGAA
jgi:hypothetical protein